MARESLHIQILRALKRDTEERQRQHEAKCGKGLEDREYQRHVGRIAECEVQLLAIARYMKAGVDELDDEEDELDREKDDRAARRRPTNR